jgi:nuclear-control-of-ATPase protein 2
MVCYQVCTVLNGSNHRYSNKFFILTRTRRIERLLTSQPESSQRNANTSLSKIPPLTAGLLLLSVTHLRTYAQRYLPMRSRLREGFLEDVEDLADPALGRHEKMRVVERMWRSWGSVLGWGSLAEVGTGRW